MVTSQTFRYHSNSNRKPRNPNGGWSNTKNERLAGMNKTNISTMINNEAINYSREKKKNQLAILSLIERRGKKKKIDGRETPDFQQ